MRAVTFCGINERNACLRELAAAVRHSGPELRDVVTAGLLAVPTAVRGQLMMSVRRWRNRKRAG